MIAAPVVLVLLAQTVQQKPVELLAGQIRRLAASEPVVFGIDTRIRTANALPVSYSKLAAELLRDDESELAGVEDDGEQSALRVQIAAAWGRFDLEQAERTIQPLRRTEEHDYIAEAYDRLYLSFEQQPARARRIVSDGLKSGGFRMISASRMLESYAASDRTAATALFSEMLTAFPSNSFFPADLIYLQEQTKQIASVNRSLAQQATDVALQAARSQRVLEQPRPVRAAESPQPSDDKKLDIDGLSYSDALTQARAIESMNDRIGALIELSRRDDLNPDQRTSVASEALHLLGESPITGDRLVGIAMVARDFARRNELAIAGLAAQMLAERFDKVCDCGGAKCRRDGEEFDCLSSVEDFAEYLDEFKVTPESMGLSNISLEARLLVLKLKTLGSH